MGSIGPNIQAARELRARIRKGLAAYGVAAGATWAKYPELVNAVEKIVQEEIGHDKQQQNSRQGHSRSEISSPSCPRQ